MPFITDNNQLTHLPQTMQTFLDNSQNFVSLYNNPLNCSNLKPHVWLLSDKAKYRDRVWGARCHGTGDYLFELQLYEGKCTLSDDNSSLHCVDIADHDFNIRQEVIFLQQIEGIPLESLRSLTVSNCNVIQISENVLAPVQRVRLVNLANLNRIDSNAFGEGNTLQSLDITGANNLQLTDILSLVNKQINLQRLSLSLGNGKPHLLPKNAFAVLSHLESIEFVPSTYRIVSIGANVVARLSSLAYFGMSGIPISEIETGAFAGIAVNDQRLYLNLSTCGIDETKLRNRPFEGANRPINLDLSKSCIFVSVEKIA